MRYTNNTSFREKLQEGYEGEEICLQWLRQQPYIKEVYDVRGLPEYRGKDIDFRILTTDNALFSIEVKTDPHTTGRMDLELKSNIELDKDGWLYTSKTDYLIQYYPNYGFMYLMDFAQLKDCYEKNKHRKDFGFQVPDYKTSTDGLYHSRNYLVFMDFLDKHNFDWCWKIPIILI